MDDNRMAITLRGLIFIAVGVGILILGYILLAGGGVKDSEVFNYEMFNFRRMVIAPVFMVAGLVVVALAILGKFDSKNKNK